MYNITKTTTEFVIHDQEWTTWEGTWGRKWSGSNEARELLRLGAVRVKWDLQKKQGEVIEEFDMMSKPTLYPVLSDYCKDLLKITQEQVDNAPAFPVVLDRFVQFCGTDKNGQEGVEEKNILVVSYGDDFDALHENVIRNGLPPIAVDSCLNAMNIAYYFRMADPSMRYVNSGNLWRHFHLNEPCRMDGKISQAHDPVYDCHSILATMNHLSARGHLIPII